MCPTYAANAAPIACDASLVRVGILGTLPRYPNSSRSSTEQIITTPTSNHCTIREEKNSECVKLRQIKNRSMSAIHWIVGTGFLCGTISGPGLSISFIFFPIHRPTGARIRVSMIGRM